MTTISPTGTALVTLDDLEAATRASAPVAAVLSGNIEWDGLRELLLRGT